MFRSNRLSAWIWTRLDQLRGESQPEAERARQDAARVGQRRAQELVAAVGTRDPVALAERRGVEITRDDWDGLARLTLFGDYADGTITIYPRQIKSVADEYGIASDQVETVAIAHELAHYEFDERRPPFLTAVPPEWVHFLRRLLGRRHEPSARELEEIAAVAFAAELVDYELLPIITAHLPESARQFIDGSDPTPNPMTEEPTAEQPTSNAGGLDVTSVPRSETQ